MVYWYPEYQSELGQISLRIENYDAGISDKKSQISKLNSRRNQLRKEAKKKKSLENPLGSGTY